ncbi:MAG: hypothetical protein AAF402_01270 [Pseudomonadota bacterium]
MKENTNQQHYTRRVLIQMLVVLIVLVAVIVWQWNTLHDIYIDNQVNKIGWAINGLISVLFICGMIELVRRFIEYHNQENSIRRFLKNVRRNEDPINGLRKTDMVVDRYLTLRDLNSRRASINQNALAATLLAAEASRNSFLKFIHNTLILTGVFGTIISLSISLLGASDMIQGSLQNEGQNSGLGTMIFGMSTALSTTMTAIIFYLIFGYFYIKLTDTQTYLISRVEEVTATTLLPHLQLDKDVVIKDFSESIRSAAELIERFDATQSEYARSADQLQQNTAQMAANVELQTRQSDAATQQQLLEKLDQLLELHLQAQQSNQKSMEQMIKLLQKGFRLKS